MKQYNFSYSSGKLFKQYLQENNIELSSDKILVQMFTSLSDIEKVENIASDICAVLPNAVLVGSSTAGEILDGVMQDGTTVLSISLFEKTKISAAFVQEKDSFSLGVKLAAKLISQKSKCLISFVDGIKHNGEEFLKGIATVNVDNILISGGISADLFTFDTTFCIYKDKVLTSAAVGVSLEGEDLEVSHSYNLGWRSVGPKFTITKSDGNRVYEINNRPVKELYKEVLGSQAVENLLVSAIEFPLLKKVDDLLVARSIVNVLEDGSIIYAGALYEGDMVQFGIGNEVLADVNDVNLHQKHIQAGFIYSCAARKQFLGKKLEKTFTKLNEIAPMSGYFTFGEFYSGSKETYLLNITTTLLFLNEKGTYHAAAKTNIDKQNNLVPSSSTSSLFNLIDYVTKELTKQEAKVTTSKFALDEFMKALDSIAIVSKTDVNGIITYANENFLKISGYSEYELVGKAHSIIRSPNSSSELFEGLWRDIKQGKIWQGELENRAKDGSLYYVKSSIIPIFDENHNIIEYMAIRENITSLIESKKAIENQIKLTKLILDNEDNIVILIKNEKVDKINQAFFRKFAYENLESFKSWHECICDLFVEREGYLTKPKKSTLWYEDLLKKPYKTHLAIMLDKHGEERIYHVTSKEVIYDSEVTYVINTFNDITEIEKAKQKAQKAEAAQAMFLANMSHEIRTPMNGILGFSELLANSSLNSSQEKYVNIIKSSTKTLLDIINDILDFSKLSGQKVELEKIEINLYSECATTFELLKAVADQKSIHYISEFDSKMFECLFADPTRLRQIIMNLVSNAIKFTPENGSVLFETLVLESNENMQIIRFSVKDSGIGIAKSKQDKIFEPFSQADSSTTREFGGTGLGLSISSSLVKAFGSKLEIESEEGKGSTFYFDIKFAKCDSLPISFEKKEVVNNKNTAADDIKLNVLIAEDYEMNRILMKSIFEQYKNIIIEFAYNGEEAVRKVEQNSYDIIFMDVNMPIMNGIEATKKIKEEFHNSIPIIALTANAIEGDKERFLTAGMDDYISKPIDVKKLNEILLKYSNSSEKKEVSFNIETLINNIISSLCIPKEVVLKLLQSFIGTLEETSSQLKEAYENNDEKKILDIVHKVKGSSATLQIEEIASLMKNIEKEMANRGIIEPNFKLGIIDKYIKLLKKGLEDVS